MKRLRKPLRRLIAEVQAAFYCLRHLHLGAQIVHCYKDDSVTWIAVVRHSADIPFNGMEILKEFYNE